MKKKTKDDEAHNNDEIHILCGGRQNPFSPL